MRPSTGLRCGPLTQLAARDVQRTADVALLPGGRRPGVDDNRGLPGLTGSGQVGRVGFGGELGGGELAGSRCLVPSHIAAADRVRRLVDAGIITGYTATVDADALGYPITAFVRLAFPSGNYKPVDDLLEVVPEVVEAHHVTGNDCFIMKVLARSMTDLERITGKLAALGSITTGVVYSSPLPRRRIATA